MSKYRHVLAAIDVTDEAAEVLAKAHQAAADSAAVLSALTVVRPLTHAYTGMEVAGLAAAAINFEAEAKASVEKSLGQLCEQYGIDDAHRHVCFGVPAIEIKQQAHQLGADLIVVGSHARHGLGLLLGSTANAVLHGAECDVLTVRVHDPE
jgi:universal stress protein A